MKQNTDFFILAIKR